MTNESIHTALRQISNEIGVLQGMMKSHAKTTDAILEQAKVTNGRLRTVEDEIKYMKPIVQDYANVRMKVLIGLFTLLAVGYAGGAGAGDIVAKVISEIVR